MRTTTTSGLSLSLMRPSSGMGFMYCGIPWCVGEGWGALGEDGVGGAPERALSSHPSMHAPHPTLQVFNISAFPAKEITRRYVGDDEARRLVGDAVGVGGDNATQEERRGAAGEAAG